MLKNCATRFALTTALAVAGLSLPATTAQLHSKGTDMKPMADQWADAFNRGDLNTLMTLYTIDAELLPKGTAAIKGHPNIRSFLTKILESRPASYRTSFKNIETFGQGDAVSEIADIEIRDEQGNIVVLGRQILVLLKQQGQWKIHRDMWTNNDKPNP